MSIVDRIREERVVAVLRSSRDVDATVATLREVGVALVEITLDSPGALDAIARHPGALAGTVRTLAQADAAIDAGAVALVSPGFYPSVIECARARGVPAIAGAFTPTEIDAAWQSGAAMVKLFPASLGGPRYIRDVLAPLADVPLIATGGITPETAPAYLEAGAQAVGLGSSLAGNPSLVAALLAQLKAPQTIRR